MFLEKVENTGKEGQVDYSRLERVGCRVCLDPIVPGAKLCPHCGSSQTSWRMVAEALKWIAGVATVISLLMGMQSLNAIYRSQHERDEAVQELVEAAAKLRDDGNHRRAWGVYQEAQELNPASRLVRRGLEELAKFWTRSTSSLRPGQD